MLNKSWPISRASNKNRTQEPTGANATSSRSHAVMMITLMKKSLQAGGQRRRRNSGGQSTEIGKLSMIDLAGSERASASANRGESFLNF